MKTKTSPWDVTSFDPRDPDPWLALYLDQTVPLLEETKKAWLEDSRSWSRQFLLPLARPFGRTLVVIIQMLKIVIPNAFTSSRLLHWFLYWGLTIWVRPRANWLILRHFNIGSEVLEFIAKNASNGEIPLKPLRPQTINAVRDEIFLQHDLNLYNFIIRLNQGLKEKNTTLGKRQPPDFSAISGGDFGIEKLPNRWTNVLDLQTAIELFTPMYQLFLTDNDFWRACNSLQLDETVGAYVAKIMGTPEHLILVNNKHPLVPLSTLSAGFRLVLHGLSSEMLYGLLVKAKEKAEGSATA